MQAMKKIFPMTVFVLGVAAAPVAYAVAGNISDDIHYEMKDWGQDLLDFLERGPSILPNDFPLTVEAFPANSSERTAEELVMLKRFEAEERTSEQLEKIRQEHMMMPLYQAFAANHIYDFDAHPVTNSLLSSVDRDVIYFILREKMKYQRARPTQLAPDLTTVIAVPKHSAYPSGHAGQVYAAALVLSAVDPANAEKYRQLAIDVAHRREIAGVHYPSDSEAGRAIAAQVVAALMKDPEIQKRIALAKKEFETSQ